MAKDENETLQAGRLGPLDEGLEELSRTNEPARPLREMLTLGKGGVPTPTLGNLSLILKHDPGWKGTIRYNELADGYELHKCPVKPDGIVELSTRWVTNAIIWLEQNYQMVVPESLVDRAFSATAYEHAYHPVRLWLASRRWDGVSRMGTLLTRYYRAEDCPLHTALSRAVMIGAVARVMTPGDEPVKLDNVLVIVGEQGSRKSTSLEVLAGRREWFSRTPLDLATKDTYEQIKGTWIYELAEFDQYRGRDQARIKSIVASDVDKYRRVWEKHATRHRRHNVFIATANDKMVLNDPTGSRRYWPVSSGEIDLSALIRDVDQLWAEAVVAFSNSEPHYLTKEMEAVREDRASEFSWSDPWEDAVTNYCRYKSQVTTPEIFMGALQIQARDMTPQEAHRIADILKRLKYKQSVRRVNGKNTKVWIATNVVTPEDLP